MIVRHLTRMEKRFRNKRGGCCPCGTRVKAGEWCILGAWRIFHPACFERWLAETDEFARALHRDL